MMEEYDSALLLPEEWDNDLGGNIYLRRDFLAFLEPVSDVENMRYYIFRDGDGAIDSRVALHLRRGHVIDQFSRGVIKADAHFVYVPLSVARPGMILGERTREDVFAFLRRFPGFMLVYNLPEGCSHKSFVSVRTCPRCVLDMRWPGFDEYLAAMRSHYRHRYKKALRKSQGLRLRFLQDNREFNEDLYALYLQVYDRATYRVEKLSLEFFRGPFFKIFVLDDEEGRAQGFVQLLENGEELIFEFVGFDHKGNTRYDTYIRMLLEIVRYGAERGFKRIDFGQTADDAKLKLGCRYETLYVLGHHSNPLINAGLKLFSRSLQYRALDDAAYHVFEASKNQPPQSGDRP